MAQKPWELGLTVYDDEAALLDGLQRREPLACTCLLKRHAPRLYRLALHFTGDPDEAEDVLQESFINACAHIADFAAQSRLETWLHRIVVNTALGRLRQQQAAANRIVAPAAATLGDLPADAATDPSRLLLDAELRDTLEQSLLALPTALRVAFVLRDLEGLSTREAATALGISEAALKVRLHRAHLALRADLAPYLTDDAPALPDATARRLLDQLCAPPTHD